MSKKHTWTAYTGFFRKLSAFGENWGSATFTDWAKVGINDWHYVAFEDTVNKQWVVYNPFADGVGVSVFPFGEISLKVIDTVVTLSPSNPNHEHDMIVYRNGGISEELLQTVAKNANNPTFREGLEELTRFLLSMQKYKAELSLGEFEIKAFNFWYKYAGFYDFENWVRYFADVDEQKTENFPDTEACRAWACFNAEYGSRCAEVITTTLFSDGDAVTGRVFLLDRAFGIGCLFPMDLLYLFRNAALHACSRCGQIYINNNLSSRYCPQCKNGIGKKGIASENRKKNKARYLHKRILDKLNSPANTTGVNAEYFKAESNYYWAKICGKKPETVPPVANPNTDTEEEYIKWLNSILPNPYLILKDRYPKK